MNIYHTRERLRTRSIYDLNLRVAFYARVSTDSEDQQVSIEHQTQYYKEFIKSNRNWKFAKGYIDNPIFTERSTTFYRALRSFPGHKEPVKYTYFFAF